MMIPCTRRFLRTGGCFFLAGLILGGSAGCGPRGLDRPAEEGAFIRGTTSRIRSFDPAGVADIASVKALSRIYEGLLQYHYLDRPYRVVPLLADRMPEVSEDGLTYTFSIRSDVYFQNDPCFTETGGTGRAVRAGDFVYAIKRVADVKNASGGYWVFDDRIRGLDAFREASRADGPTDYDRPVEGLQAPDDRTLRIRLKEPYPQLLYVLTMQYAAAVPREAVEYYGDAFGQNPVGTGPFLLEDWKRNYRVEYRRNPRWEETGRIDRYPRQGTPADRAAGRLADAGRPLPLADGVIDYVVGDEQTRWLMFLRGQFDRFGQVARANWDAVIAPDRGLDQRFRDMGISLVSRPTLDTFYLGFNMDDPVVGDNRALRQALTCAFNREQWVQLHNDRIQAANGPVPPALAGHLEDASPFAYDPDRARALLAEAGYPDGIDPETGRPLEITLTIGSADNAEIRQSSELFASFMREIGVDFQLEYMHWPAFLQKVDRRDVQIYRLGWIADYPDAQNFLQLFYGPNSSPGSNHSNYDNPAYDRLYEQLRTLPASEEKTRLVKEMGRMLVEDCPWIFLHHRMSYSLHHGWLRNVKHHDFPYGVEKYRRVDTEQRRAGRAGEGRL